MVTPIVFQRTNLQWSHKQRQSKEFDTYQNPRADSEEVLNRNIVNQEISATGDASNALPSQVSRIKLYRGLPRVFSLGRKLRPTALSSPSQAQNFDLIRGGRPAEEIRGPELG